MLYNKVEMLIELIKRDYPQAKIKTYEHIACPSVTTLIVRIEDNGQVFYFYRGYVMSDTDPFVVYEELRNAIKEQLKEG